MFSVLTTELNLDKAVKDLKLKKLSWTVLKILASQFLLIKAETTRS